MTEYSTATNRLTARVGNNNYLVANFTYSRDPPNLNRRFEAVIISNALPHDLHEISFFKNGELMFRGRITSGEIDFNTPMRHVIRGIVSDESLEESSQRSSIIDEHSVRSSTIASTIRASTIGVNRPPNTEEEHYRAAWREIIEDGVRTSITSNWDRLYTSKESGFSKEILKKAENFLKETVGEKTFKGLSENNSVEIKTKTYIYGFNRSGEIYRKRTSVLFEARQEFGKLWSNTLPMDDLLATFYLWATTNPKGLEEKWGCGTINIEDKTKDL